MPSSFVCCVALLSVPLAYDGSSGACRTAQGKARDPCENPAVMSGPRSCLHAHTVPCCCPTMHCNTSICVGMGLVCWQPLKFIILHSCWTSAIPPHPALLAELMPLFLSFSPAWIACWCPCSFQNVPNFCNHMRQCPLACQAQTYFQFLGSPVPRNCAVAPLLPSQGS